MSGAQLPTPTALVRSKGAGVANCRCFRGLLDALSRDRSFRPLVDRHAICTRWRHRRCGRDGLDLVRAGGLIRAMVPAQESRPAPSTGTRQTSCAPLPLLDASRLRCGSACHQTLARHGVLADHVAPPNVCIVMSSLLPKSSTVPLHERDVVVCTNRGGQPT